jgi:hypothetical protein
VVTKYAKITIKGTSKTVKQTLRQATKLRINNEIKHLYAKKQNINKQLRNLITLGGVNEVVLIVL